MSNYFNKDLIHKYSQNGPRYTSYPTAVEFKGDNYGAKEHIAALENSRSAQLSVYIHIPFCEHVCYYCGCNKIITRNHGQASQYLDYLEKEIALQSQHIDLSRPLVQLHFGGGTPTFLSRDEMARLFAVLHHHFNFADDLSGEFSIEIDPRTVTIEDLEYLRGLGFNRVSFGVQDFNPEVQRAVNRIQPFDDVKKTIDAARAANYHSISADLIYGLPRQTAGSFAETIGQMLELSPDRLAVFHYAHMPHIFGAQKQIRESELPSADEKLLMLEHTINELTSHDYEFIGLDHFAKKNDSLVIHQRNGTLYRNFQGYSTFGDCDLIGFGISSISMIGDSYSQNEKARSRYYQRLDANELPIMRGIVLNPDDLIRRWVIGQIMCNLKLDFDELNKRFHINGHDYFQSELNEIKNMEKDELVLLKVNELKILPLGRLLIRNVAMVFDRYLRQHEASRRFSKTL